MDGMNKCVDSLPTRGGWKYTGVALPGYPEVHAAPLWFRSIRDAITSMVSQPHLAPHMMWAPERHYTISLDDLPDGENWEKFRSYSEMNTADWWWEEQGVMPIGTTILALMFSTDETQLTMFSGDKKAYPPLSQSWEYSQSPPSSRGYVGPRPHWLSPL